jgi:hypothetical protein
MRVRVSALQLSCCLASFFFASFLPAAENTDLDNRWTGIECRTVHENEMDGEAPTTTKRVVVLDIHSVDLAGHTIPWRPIGKLDQLQELSIWDSGMGGPIDAEALCGLTQLQVLTLSDNAITGELPACMSSLSLTWFFVDNNLLHGPVFEVGVRFALYCRCWFRCSVCCKCV